MTDGCGGCVACRTQLADDESRNWPALDDASGTRDKAALYRFDLRLEIYFLSVNCGPESTMPNGC